MTEAGDHNSTAFWQQHHRDVKTLTTSVVVKAEFGCLDQMLFWCKINAEDLWKWQMISMPSEHQKGIYEFWFRSDIDAEMFTLRWKS